MKKRIIFIFALFLMLSGFSGENRIVEQNNINVQGRVSASEEALVIVKKLPRQVMVNEGQDVTFSATVSSSDYSVTWFNNLGDKIENKGRYHLSRDKNTATLRIEKVVPEDSGTYGVRFENKKGQVESRTSLFVVLPE